MSALNLGTELCSPRGSPVGNPSFKPQPRWIAGVIVLLVLTRSSGRVADRSRFRGPNANGVASSSTASSTLDLRISSGDPFFLYGYR